MFILDTTVLVCAVGRDHALAEPARRLMVAIASGRLAATTTIEVIQEFAHVRARRRSRSDAAALAREYTTLLSPLIVTTTDDLERGLGLWADHQALGAFDSVLLAACARIGGQALITADRALTNIAGIPALDLADIDSTLDAALGD